MTQIYVNRYVNCPFSATIEFAEQAMRTQGDLHLSPLPPLRERAHAVSAITADTGDTARRHDALLLAWRPQTPQLFPNFRGVLTVRPERRGVFLRLSGAYEPPLGAFGRLFDSLAGRILARQTMKNFLAGLAADIEAAYRRELVYAR